MANASNSTTNVTFSSSSIDIGQLFYLAEGTFGALLNGLVTFVIIKSKHLHKKEHIFIMGLALFSAVYSIGYLSAGIYRLSANLYSIVSGWYCFLLPQNITFLFGSIGTTLMLLLISIDRMIATKFIAFYLTLGKIYAYRYFKIVLAVAAGSTVIAAISSYVQLRNVFNVAFCSTPLAYPAWFTSVKTYSELYLSIFTISMYSMLLH